MGLELTPSGRPSVRVKKNQVNAKYGSNCSSSSSAEKILGKRLSIGRACALLGVVMLGPEIPLESAGHQDRMRIFKSAAHYCLSDEDLEDILDTKEAELELYLQGIFRAACRLPRYELAAAARQYFELNVFKPASKNKEIQEHLGLEMGQSVFDKYDFWLFCIFMYVVLPLRRSGFLAFRSTVLPSARLEGQKGSRLCRVQKRLSDALQRRTGSPDCPCPGPSLRTSAQCSS